MSATTIKVPREVRDRVQQHAAHRGKTQAAVLAEALDLLDRQVFFERLRSDVERNPESHQEKGERDNWLGGPIVSADE